MRKSQLGSCNHFEIDEFLQRSKMCGQNILNFDLPFVRTVLEISGLYGIAVEEAFYRLASGRFGRSSEMGLEFKAVENRRIVAGSYHDATHRLLLFHRKRNRRRRGWFRRE